MKKLKRPCRDTFTKSITIGSWLTIPHPSVAEILAREGFDWLTVDLEHSNSTDSC